MSGRPNPRPTLAQLLRQTVLTETGCLEWQGGRYPGDYGRVCYGGSGKQHRAHRLAYELHTGEAIPAGMFVCHRCDNPPCINPLHLFLGTNRENSEDRERKGRGVRGATHPQSKLTETDVRAIRAAYADGVSQAELCRSFDVSAATMHSLIHGRTWAWVA